MAGKESVCQFHAPRGLDELSGRFPHLGDARGFHALTPVLGAGPIGSLQASPHRTVSVLSCWPIAPLVARLIFGP